MQIIDRMRLFRRKKSIMIKFYRTQMDAKTKAVQMYLDLNDIEFESIVVEEKDASDFLKKMDVEELPVLLLDNGDIISGFNPAVLKANLG